VLLAVLNVTVKQSKFCCIFRNIRHHFSPNSSSKNEGRGIALLDTKSSMYVFVGIFKKIEVVKGKGR